MVVRDVFSGCGGLGLFSVFVVVLGGFECSYWFWVVSCDICGFGWFSVLVVVLGGFKCS